MGQGRVFRSLISTCVFYKKNQEQKMTFNTKIIKNSAKEHQCVFCLRIMPKGSMYVSAPHKSDEDGSFQNLKFCAECAYILRNADRQNFKRGNFTEQNIPNCLRKIRNEYRKDPMKAWDEQMAKENENGNDY